MPAYAIGDAHGCVATLKYLLEEEIAPARDDTLYFLGDYINKGPDPKGVLDYLLDLTAQGFSLRCLRGNHEQYMLDALRYPWERYAFEGRGGDATLRSFGVRNVSEIPERYIRFVSGMSYFYETEACILVHAGFNFDLDDPFMDDHAMLNIKKMQVDAGKVGGKVVVHGHVPTPLGTIEAAACNPGSQSVCLDGGCVYLHRDGMKYLVGMDLDSRRIYTAKNREAMQ